MPSPGVLGVVRITAVVVVVVEVVVVVVVGDSPAEYPNKLSCSVYIVACNHASDLPTLETLNSAISPNHQSAESVPL